MIRAVIFDMGGTLLKFVRPGRGSWRELEEQGIRGLYRYLVEQGHPITSHEDIFAEVMFERLAEGWEQATGGHINLRAIDWIAGGTAHHALNLDEAALLEATHQYARPLRNGLAAMPGALDALRELRERGCRTALISNTIWPAQIHLEDLDAQGLLPFLEHTIFSGEAGIWKPMPEIFQHALAALEVRPEEAVFVGDSPREDILGAQSVGMRAIWLRSPEFPLGDVQPDAVIEHQGQLIPLLTQWGWGEHSA